MGHRGIHLRNAPGPFQSTGSNWHYPSHSSDTFFSFSHSRSLSLAEAPAVAGSSLLHRLSCVTSYWDITAYLVAVPPHSFCIAFGTLGGQESDATWKTGWTRPRLVGTRPSCSPRRVGWTTFNLKRTDLSSLCFTVNHAVESGIEGHFPTKKIKSSKVAWCFRHNWVGFNHEYDCCFTGSWKNPT